MFVIISERRCGRVSSFWKKMIQKAIYNTFFKKSSTFVATIFASAFAFEMVFDTVSDTVWDSLNKGVYLTANARDNGRT
jgi:ubiquinol-cytochrome c reductase subunit 9